MVGAQARISRRAAFRALAAVPITGVLLARVPVALASEEWCSSDPKAKVWIDGRQVTVNIVVSVRKGAASLLHTARATAWASGSSVVARLQGPAVPFRAYAEIRRLHRTAGDPATIYAPSIAVDFVFKDITGGR